MKNKYVKDLMIGEEVRDQLFQLKEIGDSREGKTRLILSDKTGDVLAEMKEVSVSDAFRKQIGSAIKVDAFTINEGAKPLVVIREWSVPESFKPTDLYQGISREKAEEYKADIVKGLIPVVTHEGYRQLLEAALTEERLNKMANLPVTLHNYGRYAGAALVATDVVTRMIAGALTPYARRGNGLNTKPPAWNVLITASLLQHLGREEYYDASVPFKRSARGVALSYFSTLQAAIERVILEHQISLTEQEVANLLNILNVSVSAKTEVKAISKEGSILRHMIALYSECDMADQEAEEYEQKDGDETYHWSNDLGRWVMNGGDSHG